MNNVTNEALVEAGLAVVAPTMAPAERVARGKGFISVQRFSGSGSASVVKAQLKAANPKISSKALGRMVLETLRGERDLRSQLAVAWVQGRLAAGDVPSHGEIGSKTSTLKMVHAPEPAPEPKAEPAKPQTAEDIAKAIAELTARLAELQGAQK